MGRRGRGGTQTDPGEKGGAVQGREEPEQARPRSQRQRWSEGSETGRVYEGSAEEQGKSYLQGKGEKNK